LKENVKDKSFRFWQKIIMTKSYKDLEFHRWDYVKVIDWFYKWEDWYIQAYSEKDDKYLVSRWQWIFWIITGRFEEWIPHNFISKN